MSRSKVILIMLSMVLIATTVDAASKKTVVANDSMSAGKDYNIIVFTAPDSTNYYTTTVIGNDWAAAHLLFSPVDYLYSNGANRNIEDFRYELRKYLSGSTSDGYCMELLDSSLAIARGFIYADTTIVSESDIDTLSAEGFQDAADSVATIHNTTNTLPLLTKSYLSYVHIISFDQPDPYQAGYASGELGYRTVFSNSSTDYLERIVDTDRGDMLVGFRFYSDINNNLYTIFIEPNN